MLSYFEFEQQYPNWILIQLRLLPMTDSIATAESKANPETRRYLKAGIYAPLPTFFQPGSEDLGG